MKKRILNILGMSILVLVVGGGILLLTWRRSSVAPLPAAFERNHYSYAQAREISAQRRLPLLVFASADWCAPCQVFKRDGLADPLVNAKLRDFTVPVYINVDHNPDVSSELQVTSIPALYVVRDGKVVSKLVGVQTAPRVLEWLDAALKQ